MRRNARAACLTAMAPAPSRSSRSSTAAGVQGSTERLVRCSTFNPSPSVGSRPSAPSRNATPHGIIVMETAGVQRLGRSCRISSSAYGTKCNRREYRVGQAFQPDVYWPPYPAVRLESLTYSARRLRWVRLEGVMGSRRPGLMGQVLTVELPDELARRCATSRRLVIADSRMRSSTGSGKPLRSLTSKPCPTTSS